VFDILVRQNWIPPAPKELQGVPLKIEYESPLAQAQKMIGVQTTERFLSNLLVIAPVLPQMLDKINTDQLVDVYGEQLAIHPDIIRTDEEVAELRAEIAKKQQQAQAPEMMNQISGAAKNLSQSDMSGDNALTRVVNELNAGQPA
jgi:hypothetical protein